MTFITLTDIKGKTELSIPRVFIHTVGVHLSFHTIRKTNGRRGTELEEKG